MTPIITKTETTTVNGITVKIVGEVFDSPVKKTETAMCYTVVKIQTEHGQPLHPDFSFAAMLDEEHLTKTVNYLKEEIETKPEVYLPQFVKK